MNSNVAGYICVYNKKTNVQMFIRALARGVNPNRNMRFRILEDSRGQSRQLTVRLQGDWSKLEADQRLAKLGISAMSLSASASGSVGVTPFSVGPLSIATEPAPGEDGNFIFSSGDIVGFGIVTKHSDWATVAVIAILAATVIALAAISSDSEVKIEGEVDTIAGSGSGSITVGGGGDDDED